MTSRSISREFIVASLSMCADTGTPRWLVFISGVRIGRNVGAFLGEGITGAMGVSLEAPFLVNRKFRFFLAENARNCPGFRPVFACPAGRAAQPSTAASI